jgi:multicomponent Na+:H+ antiporter subunit B
MKDKAPAGKDMSREKAAPVKATIPGTLPAASGSASRLVGAAALLVVAGFFMLAVTGLPEFGSFQNKHVAEFYLENALESTGSPNAVNAIVWDFRGYDTLGEETVLFCAALGVFMIIRRKKYGRPNKDNI